MPRSTSTSVTAPLSVFRLEIASRCAWLLLRAGFDQGVVVEPRRQRQHGACDLDQVVECKGTDGLRRRGLDRGEAVGEQRLGRVFDVLEQALEDVVEQHDLLVRIVDRAVDEEVGHAAQRLDTACDGAVRERRLQFVEQTFGGGLGLRTHDSVLERWRRILRRRIGK
ncbi:hypothetical protein ACVWY2_009498 [Bradyrhizobium sp. JR6.1]